MRVDRRWFMTAATATATATRDGETTGSAQHTLLLHFWFRHSRRHREKGRIRGRQAERVESEYGMPARVIQALIAIMSSSFSRSRFPPSVSPASRTLSLSANTHTLTHSLPAFPLTGSSATSILASKQQQHTHSQTLWFSDTITECSRDSVCRLHRRLSILPPDTRSFGQQLLR